MTAIENDTVSSIRLADASLQTQNLSDCHFLVYIGTGSLAYAVFDTVSNTIVAFNSKPLSTEDYLNESIIVLRNEEWLKGNNYAQVKVIVEPAEYVLVPQDLFDPTDIASYLRFHSFHEPVGSTLYDTIEPLKVAGAYHLPHQALNMLDSLLGNITVCAAPTPFIQLATREYKSGKNDHLLVMFAHRRMHLAGVHQGKFVFYNSFEIAATDDVSYYALAACEQLYLSPEKVTLTVWGDAPNYTEYLTALGYYFRHVEHGARPKALKYAEALDGLPNYVHYPLFAAAL